MTVASGASGPKLGRSLPGERSAHAELDGRVVAVALIVLLAAATLLRLPSLNAQSLWNDEAISWWQSKDSFGELLSRTAADNYPPLHNVILFLVMPVFGDSEVALRLPSAIFGLLNVPAIYWVGSMLGGRRAGLLAAVLLTFSGFHIWFSQEARMYALLALASTMFVGTAIQMARAPNQGRAVAMVLTGMALSYSHAYGPLTLIGVAVGILMAMFLDPKSFRLGLAPFVLLNVVIGLAFLPWAIVLLTRARALAVDGFWTPYPSFTVLGGFFYELTNGQRLILLLGSTAAVFFFVRQKASPPASSALLPPQTALIVVLGWVFVPFFLAFIASIAITPVLFPRYLICILPGMMVLAGMGLGALGRNRLVLAALCLLCAGLQWYGYLRHSLPMREDWRAVAALLRERANAPDCVIAVPGWQTGALRYYRRDPGCLTAADTTADLRQEAYRGVTYLIFTRRTDYEREAMLKALEARQTLRERIPFNRIDVYVFDPPVAAGAAL